VLAAWDRGGAIEDPTAYLYRTAMNVFRSKRGRAGVAVRRPIGQVPHDDGFEQVESMDAALRALASLSERQRAAVVQMDLLGYFLPGGSPHARRSGPRRCGCTRPGHPDELERWLQARLDALGPAPRAELLHVLMLPDFERADRIGEFCGYPKSRAFAELVIDCEEDRVLRAVLVGILRDMERR
jgi:hypothetical protein